MNDSFILLNSHNHWLLTSFLSLVPASLPGEPDIGKYACGRRAQQPPRIDSSYDFLPGQYHHLEDMGAGDSDLFAQPTLAHPLGLFAIKYYHKVLAFAKILLLNLVFVGVIGQVH